MMSVRIVKATYLHVYSAYGFLPGHAAFCRYCCRGDSYIACSLRTRWQPYMAFVRKCRSATYICLHCKAQPAGGHSVRSSIDQNKLTRNHRCILIYTVPTHADTFGCSLIQDLCRNPSSFDAHVWGGRLLQKKTSALNQTHTLHIDSRPWPSTSISHFLLLTNSGLMP
jgi:hypothetical protein